MIELARIIVHGTPGEFKTHIETGSFQMKIQTANAFSQGLLPSVGAALFTHDETEIDFMFELSNLIPFHESDSERMHGLLLSLKYRTQKKRQKTIMSRLLQVFTSISKAKVA